MWRCEKGNIRVIVTTIVYDVSHHSHLVSLNHVVFSTDACKATEHQLVDVLGLASQWRMDKVLKTAVCHLSSMALDPITKLELTKKHDIQDQEWRFSAIHDLIKSNEELTEGHANRIGCDVALKIARIRGIVHAQNRELFSDDDDWKLFIDRLAKEGTLKDKWQSMATLLFQ